MGITKKFDKQRNKKGTNIIYQVTYKIESKETFDRDFVPLLTIGDNFPNYVLSMDKNLQYNIEGIKHIHIFDFLNKKSL